MRVLPLSRTSALSCRASAPPFGSALDRLFDEFRSKGGASR